MKRINRVCHPSILQGDGDREDLITYAREVAELRASAAIAQKRVNELEAALRFYADEWKEVGVCVDSVKVPTMNLERDAGFKARAALPTMLKGNGDG